MEGRRTGSEVFLSHSLTLTTALSLSLRLSASVSASTSLSLSLSLSPSLSHSFPRCHFHCHSHSHYLPHALHHSYSHLLRWLTPVFVGERTRILFVSTPTDCWWERGLAEMVLCKAEKLNLKKGKLKSNNSEIKCSKINWKLNYTKTTKIRSQ